MRLRYSEPARRDLKSIYQQSARQFGVAQADRYRDGLLSALKFIAENPLAVSVREGHSRPLRAHFHQSHVIIFVIEDDAVVVGRVLHQSQDWQDQI